MKIKHNHHGWAPDPTDPEWAERVEREAERTTANAEHRWHKAQERLARAILRAERAERARERQPRRDKREVERLWERVAQRRDELKAFERVANRSPAGSRNRGKGSHRGVATGEAL